MQEKNNQQKNEKDIASQDTSNIELLRRDFSVGNSNFEITENVNKINRVELREYGLLSLYTYEDIINIKKGEIFNFSFNSDYNKHLTQWEIIDKYSDQISHSLCVIYKSNTKKELVVAFRGISTEQQGLLGSKSCYMPATMIFNENFKAQIEYVNNILEKVSVFKDKLNTLVLTGHFTGGLLSEIALYNELKLQNSQNKNYHNINIKVVNFDSPGSKMRLEGMLDKDQQVIAKSLITTYMTAPNPLNTIYEHVGQVYRLRPEYDLENWTNSIVYQDGITFTASFFDKMIRLIDNSQIETIAEWPQYNFFKAGMKEKIQKMVIGCFNKCGWQDEEPLFGLARVMSDLLNIRINEQPELWNDFCTLTRGNNYAHEKQIKTYEIKPLQIENKQQIVLEKNIQVQFIKQEVTFTSHQVHGLLSLHSYKDNHKTGEAVIFEVSQENENQQQNQQHFADWNKTLAGWKIMNVYNDGYAVLYVNEQNKHLVLAYRVKLDESEGEQKMIDILRNNVLKQQKTAFVISDDAIKTGQSKGYSLGLTGHGLGGWLAELSLYFALTTDNPLKNNIDDYILKAKAITFDSPGSYPLMEQLKSNLRNAENEIKQERLEKQLKNSIIKYFSAPNPLNTCYEHIGKIYRLFPERELETWQEEVKSMQDANWLEKKSGWINLQPFNLLKMNVQILEIMMKDFTNKGPKSPYKEVIDWPLLKMQNSADVIKNSIDILLKQIPLVGNIISALGAKIMHGFVKDASSVQMIEVVADLLDGNIDQSQYWKALSSATQKEGKYTSINTKFSNLYEAHYDVKNVDEYIAVLPEYNLKNTMDWYITKLYKYKNYVSKIGNPDEQLKSLMKQYRISRCGTKIITTKDITVEDLKQEIEIHMSDKIKDILLESKVKIDDQIITLINNSPVTIDERYLPRPQYIEEIEQKFENHKRVILTAFGGTGKSSIAAEYSTSKNKQQNFNIRWFNANTDKLFGEYQNFAKILGIENLEEEKEEVLMQSVHYKIANYQNEFLFIFDNVNSYENIKDYAQNLPKNVKLLITTQQDLQISENYEIIKLQPFTEDEAQEYIQKQLPKLKTNKDEVQKLLNKVTLLPQKLSMAVAFLKDANLSVTIDKYIQKVDYISEQLKKGKKIDGKDENAKLVLLANFIITAEKLISQNPIAWKMLQYSAFLDPDFIPIEALENVLEKDLDVINDLDKMIKSLKKFSLVSVVTKDGVEGIHIHQITQNDVQEYRTINAEQSIPLGQIQGDLEKTLDALMPYINSNPDEKWEKAKLYHACVKKFVDTQTQDVNSKMANLSNKIGVIFYHIFYDLQLSLKYFERVLEMMHKLYNEWPHPNVANLLDKVGVIYEALGGHDNVQKGLNLLETALEMRQQLHKKKPHLNVASSLNNVGKAYQALGGQENVQKGLKLQEQALEMRQQLHKGQPHPDVARSLNSVGGTYKNLGGHDNVQKGLKLLEQALEMRQQLHNGQPHPDVASSFNNVGEAYKDLGGHDNVQKGLKLIEQALEMKQRLYNGQPHPNVASSLNSVGLAYKALGGQENIQKGLKLQETALDMLQQLHKGQPHPNVASSLDNVGIAYKALRGQENVQKGLKLQEQALEMRQQLHNGQLHPDVARSLNNLGVAYEALGGQDNVQKGLKLLEQALEMRQQLHKGQPHPEVAVSLNDVGLAYKALGGQENIQKGLKLQKTALEMLQQLHNGQPHPDVATSLNNVGIAYEDLGGQENIQKGLKLKEQALEMKQQLHNGELHSDVATSLNNVGWAYKDLGGQDNVQKSLKLLEQALDMWQQLNNGQPHSDVANTMTNLGMACVYLGEEDSIQRGLQLQEDAFKMYQQIYPDQLHFNIARTLNKRGMTYQKLEGKENIQQALDYFKQAYIMSKKLDGEDNANTQKYKENVLNIDPDYFKNNPGGEAQWIEKQEDMPMYKWFTKYYAEGMDGLLALRSKDLKQAVSLSFMQLKDNTGQMVHMAEDMMQNSDSGFSKVVAQAFDKAATVLIPLNLYGKHWVGLGLSLDKSDNTIQVTYIDPENSAIPAELQHYLEAVFPSYPKIIILQRFVEAQKYKNCGPQVIEELVALAAEREGKAHIKIPQEEVIPEHSMLLEKKLLSSPPKVLPSILPNSEDIKYHVEQDGKNYKLTMEHKFSIMHSKEMVLDQNQPSYLILDEKALAQLKHYTKTGMLLPTAQAALENGAQINIRYNITDVYHTRIVTFSEQHYMDEKTMAQILHYINGGQMFDTLRYTVINNVVHFEEVTYTINRQVEEQMHQTHRSQEVMMPIAPQPNIQIDEESTTDNDQQHHLILNLFTFIKNTLHEHYILYFIES